MLNNRILFLLHLPPPIHGSSMVGKWIHESEVINKELDTRYINLLASNSVKETGKFSFRKLINTFMIGLKLLYEIIFHHPDKVYYALTVNGFALYRDFVFCILIKLFRVKIIFHLHNKGVQPASKNKIKKLIFQFIFGKEKVILLSEHLYEDVKAFVPKENVEVCPNGIPNVEINFQEKKQNEVPKILFLSNLLEAKGVFILLDALKKLAEKGMNFEGIFAGGEGDVTQKEFEEKKTVLQLQKQVQYVGRKYGEEKNALFNEVDIFVLPSLDECFPLVILEAMQFALPVISSPEGGIPDLVIENETGIIVPQKDVQELSNALEKLLLYPELRERLGKQGRKRYVENYTLERFESRMLQILMEF